MAVPLWIAGVLLPLSRCKLSRGVKRRTRTRTLRGKSGGKTAALQNVQGERLANGSELKKKRVVSGMRPTGRLHIGHYFGALQNWVRLQNDPSYDCFYFIADWHALTSDYADTSAVAQNTLEIMTDYLAAGLDPQKSVIFQQSQVPEHAELHLLLSMVTPLGWLERVPTYKEALENVKDKDLHTYGFLGYPVLQTGDIVIYGQPGGALLVPVGEDQVSHVEITREIVRRFDIAYSEPDWGKLSSEQIKELEKHFDTSTAAAIPSNLPVGEKRRRAMRGAPLDYRASVLANAKISRRDVLQEP